MQEPEYNCGTNQPTTTIIGATRRTATTRLHKRTPGKKRQQTTMTEPNENHEPNDRPQNQPTQTQQGQTTAKNGTKQKLPHQQHEQSQTQTTRNNIATHDLNSVAQGDSDIDLVGIKTTRYNKTNGGPRRNDASEPKPDIDWESYKVTTGRPRGAPVIIYFHPRRNRQGANALASRLEPCFNQNSKPRVGVVCPLPPRVPGLQEIPLLARAGGPPLQLITAQKPTVEDDPFPRNNNIFFLTANVVQPIPRPPPSIQAEIERCPCERFKPGGPSGPPPLILPKFPETVSAK